jgi:hypothetical protein
MECLTRRPIRRSAFWANASAVGNALRGVPRLGPRILPIRLRRPKERHRGRSLQTVEPTPAALRFPFFNFHFTFCNLQFACCRLQPTVLPSQPKAEASVSGFCHFGLPPSPCRLAAPRPHPGTAVWLAALPPCVIISDSLSQIPHLWFPFSKVRFYGSRRLFTLPRR